MSTDIFSKNHFSGHAAQYASARPQYIRELVKSELQQVWLRLNVIPDDRAETMQKVLSWPLSLREAGNPT